jgi:threonine aldolase
MTRIDLRSDTVTQPTEGMRLAMAKADVGDDQYGEDPSVNLLQERIAKLLDKEAAIFVPSGTMANQTALKILTCPGDDVIVSEEAHILLHESGASGANSGIQFTVVGADGLFTADDFLEAYKAPGHVVLPPTTLVTIENTHNRGSGVLFPQDEIVSICSAAKAQGIRSLCDGARLFNAATASGQRLSELAAPFDVVTLALSKGLGCPVGSLVVGRAGDMKRAKRVRRMFGGAMRQSGILAAAGLYALDNHLSRLSEDHENAKLIAEKISGLSGVILDFKKIQSNIVIWSLEENMPDAKRIVAQAKEEGVLLNVFGTRRVRAVTHLNVSRKECIQAADILSRILERK